MYRTNTCGELTNKNIGQNVVLAGWCDTIRDHGNLTFVDLRDRFGITQIVFDYSNKNISDLVKTLRKEFVIRVEGVVSKRPIGTENKNVSNGDIEVVVSILKIISEALPLPVDLTSRTNTNDDLLLKYRYLSLRRKEIQEKFLLRHNIVRVVRNFYHENNFVEIETPILAKSTPEGARDYLVPSRVNPGKFYALPQSPQLFKQLLMISGFDKYLQIAKCFRDEDLRADRQPEFTQIDVEMSFIDQTNIIDLHEKLMQKIWDEILGVKISVPFPILSYEEAMARFGVDKPDLRFDLELIDLTNILSKDEFNAFNNVVKENGLIKGINFKGKADLSRNDVSKLEEFVKIYRAKGLAVLKFVNNKFEGSIAKFFSEHTLDLLKEKASVEENDLLLIVADKEKIVCDSLGNLRNHLAKKFDLIDETKWAFVWVVDFPMFELDEEEQRPKATHHPFTSPKQSDLHLLESDPFVVKSDAYDLVLNGFELGGGSIRIYDPILQKRIFNILKISDIEAEEKFGFFLEAFKFGTPPHGGIAFGLDRLVMLLSKSNDIRETIAFPKNKAACSPMDGSPGKVSQKQLDELYLITSFVEDNKKIQK